MTDALRPVTMQDVRLRAGEGPLDPGTMLAAFNAELAHRAAHGEVSNAIAQAHAAGMREGLEAAAKLADDNRTDDGRMWDRAAETIAAAIRDRITTGGGE